MFRASIATVWTSLLLAIVALVNASVTARGLGVEGRGLLASALLVMALARGIALMGLGDAFVYQGRAGRLGSRPEQHLTAAMVTTLVVAGILAMAAVPWTPLSGRMQLALLVGAVAMGGAVSDLVIACARLQSGLSAFNRIRVFSPIVSTGVILIVWLFDLLTVGRVLMIMVTVITAAIIWGLLLLRPLLAGLPEPDASPIARMSLPAFIKSGIGFQGIALLGILLTHVHMLVVMTVGTLGAFGVYSAAFGLSRMIAPIQMSIGSVVFSSSAGGEGMSGGVAALRAFRMTFLPLLVMAALGGALSPWVSRFLLGDAFATAAIPLAILLVEAVLGGAAFILGQHLKATGQVRAVLVRNAISILPILLGFVILTDGSVVVGMALLLLASSSVRLVATLMTYRREFGAAALRILPTAEDVRLLKQIVWAR